MAGIPPPEATAALATAAPGMVQMTQETYDVFSRTFFAYQMGALVEVLFIAFLFFVFKPFLPFVLSKIWNHLPVVGIMTRVRNIIPFGGFTLRNGLYRKEYKDNVMYFDKKYLGSFYFMGVPFDFVHIDRGFVQDPIYNKFVATLDTMGYHDINAVENALTFNGIDRNDDGIDDIIRNLGFTSYEQAKRVLNPSNLVATTNIIAPLYAALPMDELLHYCADIPPGSIAAQVADTFEFRKPPPDESKLAELLPYAVLFVCMAIALVILATQIK